MYRDEGYRAHATVSVPRRGSASARLRRGERVLALKSDKTSRWLSGD